MKKWSLIDPVGTPPDYEPASGSPVMINCMFRTGSSYLFECFRQRPNLLGFQEPCHEIHLKPTNPLEAEGPLNTDLRKFLRHPPTDRAYFHEFARLAGRHRAFLRKEQPFDRFFLRAQDPAPELQGYLRLLVEQAAERRCVLQFCRFFFRSAWLKENFHPLLIHLHRNPREQWMSYQVAPYFLATNWLIINAGHLPQEVGALARRLKFKPFHHADIDREILHFEGLATAAEEGYFLFYALWCLSLLYNLSHAHLSISIDQLSQSTEYRGEIRDQLEKYSLPGMDFSDCKIGHHASGAAEAAAMHRVEQKVLEFLAEQQVPAHLLALIPPEPVPPGRARRRGQADPIAPTTGSEENLAQLRETVRRLQHEQILLTKAARDKDGQIATLTALAHAQAKSDTVRLDQIEQLTRLVHQHEAESAERAGQIAQLTAHIQAGEAASTNAAESVAVLTTLVGQHESESAARLGQVQELTALVKQREVESAARLAQVQELTALVRQHEAESAARLAQVQELTGFVKQRESESAARLAQVQELTVLVRQHEAESAARLSQVERLTGLVKQSEAESTDRASQADRLAGLGRELASESAERLRQVHQLTSLVGLHERESADRAVQISRLTGWLKESRAEAGALQEELLQLNRICRAELAEKDQAYQSVVVQLAEQGQVLRERDLVVARLDRDVRTLNNLIHSGQLTAALRNSVRQARREASLANDLLAKSATLPATGSARWLQLPPASLVPETQPSVVSNVELIECGLNLTRISGWAFVDDPRADPNDFPYLACFTPRALWLFGGAVLERPDVAACYLAEGPAAFNRLRSGFVFEFPSSQLPASTSRTFRVIVGQMNGAPVMTPSFSIP